MKEEEEYSDSDISHLHLGNANYNYMERLLNEENKNTRKQSITIQDKIFFIKANNIKKATCIALLLLVFLQSNFDLIYKEYNIECLNDYFQNTALPLNNFLANNETIKYIITIVLSICCDLLFLTISVIWLTRSKSYRFIISIVAFILLSLISNYLLQIEKAMSHNIWVFPGVPGIILNYTCVAFIYPIDIGLMFICGFEFGKRKLNSLKFLCFGISCAVGIMKLICQSIYYPGFLMSIICADLIYDVVDHNIRIIDSSELGISQRKLSD